MQYCTAMCMFVASEEIGLGVNTGNTTHMFISRCQIGGQNRYVVTALKYFENVGKLKYCIICGNDNDKSTLYL